MKTATQSLFWEVVNNGSLNKASNLLRVVKNTTSLEIIKLVSGNSGITQTRIWTRLRHRSFGQSYVCQKLGEMVEVGVLIATKRGKYVHLSLIHI